MHEFAIDSTELSVPFKIIPAKSNERDSTKNLNELIQCKIREKKQFFSIEISPTANGENLDYNRFGSNQPLFTSITWQFDRNVRYKCMSETPALQLAKSIDKCNPVLMHLTCYKLNEAKLKDTLDNNIVNVLALKGGKIYYMYCEP